MSGDRKLRVAVIGATGLVGQEILSLLAEREFPVGELLLYASERSEGSRVPYGDDELVARRFPAEPPAVDLAFLCASAEVSTDVAEDLAGAGTAVIDLSPASRRRQDVPLALPGWGTAEVISVAAGGVVAVPHPLAHFLAVPLRALGEVVRLRRVLATALLSASEFGRRGVEALSGETVALLNSQEFEGVEDRRVAAFSCVPENPEAEDLGIEVAGQVSRLLATPVPVSVSIVYTPTFYAHGALVSVEGDGPVLVERVRVSLREAPSLVLEEIPAGTIEAVGAEGIHVGALRVDANDPRWLHFWMAGDNVRQGAALAAVALAEAIARHR